MDLAAAKHGGGEKKQPTREKTPTSLTRLLICFFGINICYMYYGVVQERLFRPDARANGQRFDNTLFLFGTQCFMNALFAFLAKQFTSRQTSSSHHSKTLYERPLTSTIPFPNGLVWLAFISLTYLVAMLTSNEALKFVSYPIQALSKSCKIVPVMLANALVGVKYKPYEYVIVGMITLGITLTQYKGGSSSENTNESWTGMLLLLASLCLDGVTGSNQHLFDHEYGLSAHDLMFGMNVFAFLYTWAALLFTGELMRGVHYLVDHPWIQTDIVLFGLASALGQNFIFYTITGPGPLVCTTITTSRKFFTILLSVFQYPETNSLALQQWMGVGLVFSALGLEIGMKAQKRMKKD